MNTPPLLTHRIGDEWIAETPCGEIRNPAIPDEVVALVSAGHPAHHLAAAAAAARAALPAWSAMPAPARGEILFRAGALLAERAERIGRDLAREEGKTLAEGIGETRRAAAILRYFAGQTSEPIGEVYASATPGTRLYTQRYPVGVVAAITPWNFPIAIPAWKIAPALAYGNTVLFKPAGATPLTAHHLVSGAGRCRAATGRPVAGVRGRRVRRGCLGRESGAVDAVTFTGSETGRPPAAVRPPARSTHACSWSWAARTPSSWRPTPTSARAADSIVRGAMASAGQKCTATSRVIAIGECHSTAPRGDRGASHGTPGRRPDRSCDDPGACHRRRGPGPRRGAWSRTRRRTGRASSSARPCRRCGAFHPATVIDGVTPGMRIAQDEVFGPVVALMAAADLDEAHPPPQRGWRTACPGSIFTRDLATAEAFIATARVGLVHVNGETAGAEPHVPFGGMKGSSSWSREQGKSAADFFTQTKTVYVEGLPSLGPVRSMTSPAPVRARSR